MVCIDNNAMSKQHCNATGQCKDTHIKDCVFLISLCLPLLPVRTVVLPGLSKNRIILPSVVLSASRGKHEASAREHICLSHIILNPWHWYPLQRKHLARLAVFKFWQTLLQELSFTPSPHSDNRSWHPELLYSLSPETHAILKTQKTRPPSQGGTAIE